MREDRENRYICFYNLKIMTIRFDINFATSPGDRMFLVTDIRGKHPHSDKGEYPHKNEMAMTPEENHGWTASLKAEEGDEISYGFLIKCSSGLVMHEAGSPRRFIAGNGNIYMHCSWQGYDASAPLLTSPFTKIFFPHRAVMPSFGNVPGNAGIIVTVPAVKPGTSVCISGENEALGRWDTAKALKMKPLDGARWTASVPLQKPSERLVFKFILKDGNQDIEDGTGNILWEDGDNRTLDTCRQHIYEYPAAAFRRTLPRYSGTAVPVFSLRTRDGYGIGDFSCIKKAADWLHATGQNILQILPVNDTLATFSWADSYPYNAISAIALNPMYLNPSLVGDLSRPSTADRQDKYEEALQELERRRKTIDASDSVDFEAVIALKNNYIHLLFDRFSESTFASGGFKRFWDENKEWLLPYAAFCTLRDEYKTPDFNKWGENAVYAANLAEKMFYGKENYHDRMSVYIFTQYHLHVQLADAVSYAASKGIAIMGDIPIGISPCSVEAWTLPEYFNMGFSAGAPPDYFSKDGQNWGFPTYNWENMAKDGYSWWKSRLNKMSQYFTMYRIDHILGFFRIWEIPRGIFSGKSGHFHPALPYSEKELLSSGFNFDPHRHAIAASALKPYPHNASGFDALFILDALFIEDPRTAGLYHPLINGTDTPSFKALDKGQQEIYRHLHDDFFYHRHNDFWKKGAMLKLSEIVSSTDMTACAEDLGMIPACVPEVLDNLKIATLEIQRMPKAPDTEFADPAAYPYLSVCSTGTHDVSTLRGWWEEDPDRSQRYYTNVLGMAGQAPKKCTPAICRAIIAAHLQSPSAFAIFPIQDWLAALSRETDTVAPNQIFDTPTFGKRAGTVTPCQESDTEKGRAHLKTRMTSPDEEQINNPADPHHHWKYRMPVTFEELLEMCYTKGQVHK